MGAAVFSCPRLPPFLGLKIVVSTVRFCRSPPSFLRLVKNRLSELLMASQSFARQRRDHSAGRVVRVIHRQITDDQALRFPEGTATTRFSGFSITVRNPVIAGSVSASALSRSQE